MILAGRLLTLWSMDRAIGRVLDHLRDVNELDSEQGDGVHVLWLALLTRVDTFILFMSDNGAEGAAYEGTRFTIVCLT